MLDQQVLEEIYTIAEKVGAHQVLTEREQAMYDDILEDAGYYQVFKNCRFFCSKNCQLIGGKSRGDYN